ncbi:MAG: hypothetical protein H7343_22410 [Undibacterium sp.]|nr:hypothetical protein [Opitutaceae bacterium]
MTNEQLFALIKKNPLSVGCGVLALLIGVVISVRIDSVPERAKLLEQKIAEGERLNANVNNAAQLPEQLAALTEARIEIEKRLVRGADLAQNLQYFYRLEADTGVKLINLRQNSSGVTKPGANGPLAGVGFTVSFQGSYFTVMEFLRRLESGTHYSRFTVVNLVFAGANRNGPLVMSVSLELLGQP